MEQFFCETLAVNNLEWTDVINELKALKQQPAGIRSEVIEELYSILSSMSSILDSDKELIRWVVCALGIYKTDQLQKLLRRGQSYILRTQWHGRVVSAISMCLVRHNPHSREDCT
jgi:hypothetical protein